MPIFDENRERWKVDVPASISETGRRFRAWFDSRETARAWLEETVGERASPVINPALAMDAETARQRLEAAGMDVTLAEAVRELLEAKQVLGDAGSLLDAAQAFAATHAARIASRPLGEAVALFMDSKGETLRAATLKSYAYTLERTIAELHPRMMADIEAPDLAAIFGPKAPTARAMHVRNLRAFWSWACKEPRGWARPDLLDALEYRKEASEGDTVTLKPAEARALLEAAERESGNAAAAYALAVFAGVRMGELEKLTWAHVGSDHVEIDRAIAKRNARRSIPLSPTLAAWLSTHRPTDAAPSDLIVGPNWREVSRSVRRRAGWDVAARLLTNPPEPTRGPWPANACRHTCASVLVATGEPLETLVFQFGHSGGHDLLRRHYVGRMTKRQALEILSIGPNRSKVKTITAA